MLSRLAGCGAGSQICARERSPVATHPNVRYAGDESRTDGHHPHPIRAVRELRIEDPGGFPAAAPMRATSTNGRAEHKPRARRGSRRATTVSVVQREMPRFDRSGGGRGVRKGSSRRSSSGRSVRSTRAATMTPARQYGPLGEHDYERVDRLAAIAFVRPRPFDERVASRAVARLSTVARDDARTCADRARGRCAPPATSTRAMLPLSSTPASGSSVRRDDHESPKRLKLGDEPGPSGSSPLNVADFADDRSASHRADRHDALEHLREVMVDRILLERAHHRVVAAERREAATGEQRRTNAARACRRRRRSSSCTYACGCRRST